MEEYFKEKIKEVKINNLYRCEKEIDSINIKINLASNDYMNMSQNDILKDKVIEASKLYGVGSPSSRLVSGTLSIHKELEREISKIKKTEDTILVGSGYIANIGVINAICNRDFVIFSDKINHASIVDGAILSRANFVRYKHGDYKDLENQIAKYIDKKKVIITDGVFSMDGDIAPLKEICRIANDSNSVLIVDDAHGFGVLGENGGGSIEYLGLQGENIIHVGTLSKAAGLYGGFVSGKGYVIDYLRNFLRGFIYSTALPPTVVYPAIESIRILAEMKEERRILQENSNYLRERLIDMDMETLGYDTPIVPIILKCEKKVLEVSKRLLDEGIYVPAIRVPTVPKNQARLRVSLGQKTTRKEIDIFLEKIKGIV
ncbi:aminotransferase class I/II-fold pyridoxal phosphate-dependent enzyme [Clostridium cylindrosporum]|uniref:8-amino-7-oxononanoate synthase n=1 Tax=Clostridium cylindrosporum DSM 605 TaxID=1121307 RepID=A0A0J8D9E0_CLOCY|nr:aminotransferase class I/II-fold pyridoxal phosphate-dependent enzyme [Clostridium cylindrosporum]KMT20908.1 8-amino-7-oxononanoate synthase [Clostridium cylindrosporum DSM 605]